ncbi:MAG: IclR family transcriptional regulator [Spirochaetia bacterium]
MSNQASDVMKLLEIFCRSNHPMSITELSELMLEAKSVVFNRANVLKELGYIEQDEHSKRYTLTTKLLELTNASLSGYYQRTNIHTYLKAIADQTGHCTYFGLRNKQNRVVYVDRYASENAMTVYTNVGDSPIPHCTAHGKALLAFLSLEEIEWVLAQGMEKFTDRTITDRDALLNELRSIRQKGFAIDDEERMRGVRCVAAPVFNSYRQVIGAIGISGMAQLLTDSVLESYARIVKDVADKVSISIGNDIAF